MSVINPLISTADMRPAQFPFKAVLFDCDGVLVDSVPITHTVLAEMLTELGWPTTPAQSMQRFAGRAIKEHFNTIKQHSKRLIDEDWISEFRARRDAALALNVLPIPGVELAVRQTRALAGGTVACVSGSDRKKISMQLKKVGLNALFEPHIFCGDEYERSKPAPDVYLAACAALNLAPQDCAVIEDSVAGVKAGVAAGCVVYGFASADTTYVAEQDLIAAGAYQTFKDMRELPSLLATVSL